MSEVTVWVDNKPVKVNWDNPNPPSSDDIDDIVAAYRSRPKATAATPSRPLNTGRIGSTGTRMSPIPGTLDGGNAPFQPFGPEGKVETGGKAVTKQAVQTDYDLVNLTRAAAMGDVVAQAKLLQVAGAKPVKPQRDEAKALANKLQAPTIPLPTVQPKAAPSVDIRANPTRDAIQNAARQVTEEQKKKPIQSGYFKDPELNGVHWAQYGPGYQADVDGTIVKAANRNELMQRAKQVRSQALEQNQTQIQSPNVAAYAPSDGNAVPPNVQSPYTSQQTQLDNTGRIGANERQRKEAFNKKVEKFGDALGLAASAASPLGVGNEYSKLAGNAVAQIAAGIPNAGWEAATLQSDNFTTEEKAGAAFNLIFQGLTSSVGMGASLSDDIVEGAVKTIKGLFDGVNSPGFDKALKGLTLSPDVETGVRDFLKQNPNLTFKGFTPEGKPVFSAKAAGRKVEPVVPSSTKTEPATKTAQKPNEIIETAPTSTAKVKATPQAEPVKAQKPKPTVPNPQKTETTPTKPLKDLKTGEGATGLANQQKARERAAGKLGAEYDVKGKSIEDLHKEGKRQYESGELDIENVIRKLAEERRPATGIEYGAGLEHKRRLMQRQEIATKELDAAIGAGRRGDLGRLKQAVIDSQKEVTRWSNLVDETATAWSDSGRGLQIGTTISEGRLAEVLQARARSKGVSVDELSNAEKRGIEKQVKLLQEDLKKAGIDFDPTGDKALHDVLEEWRGKVLSADRAKAEAVLTTSRRPGKAKTIEGIRKQRADAASRIMAHVAKSGSQIGAGPGQTFTALREAFPEIVQDVKTIVGSLADEFKIRTLGKQLFDGVRAQLPGVDISDDDIVKVLSGEWDEKVKRTESLYAELSKQARVKNLEPVTKAKAALESDLKSARQSVKDAESKLAREKMVSDAIDDAKGPNNSRVAELKQKQLDYDRKLAQREVEKLEKRLEDIEDLEYQIKSGDYERAKKQVRQESKNQQLLDLTISGRRRQIRQLIAEEDRGRFEKIVMGTANIARSAKLGSDAGMLLRQGLFTLGRGKANAQAIRNALDALKSEDAWLALNESSYYKELKDGRLAEPIRRNAGLATSDIHLDPEEFGVIHQLKKIPILGKVTGSLERAQSAYINTIRREVFDDFVNKFPDAAESELKARSRFINAATGRSNWKDVPKPLQAVMTSPRYTASRWEMIGEYMRNPSEALQSQAARENLKDLGATAASVAVALKLMEAVGFDVDWDYTSNDFLKVRRGGTVYDPTAGMGKVLRTAIRIPAFMTGRLETKFGSSAKDELGKIFSDTASPILSAIQTGFTGKSLGGMPLKDTEKGLWVLAPLVMSGFAEGVATEGVGQAAIDALPEFFGIGVNRYPSKKKDSLGRPSDSKQEARDKDALDELRRVKVEIEPAKKRSKFEAPETDKEYEARAKAQSESVLNALRDTLYSKQYGNLTLREKSEELKRVTSEAKREFNREYNSAQADKKSTERSLEIERQMKAGIK